MYSLTVEEYNAWCAFNEMNTLLATKRAGTFVLCASPTWQWICNDKIACWPASWRISEKETK